MKNFSEKEIAIFEKYPKLFRRAYLDMTQTCMCWGAEVPDGWLAKIETLCEQINAISPDSIEFEQIKVKWGELRIYFDFVNETSKEDEKKIEALIDNLEMECRDTKLLY